MLIDEADCYRFAVSAAGLKRDEPAKAGSFRVKFWKVLAKAKVLRKVLSKVLKGTWRYDVLQNVTDRLTTQELSMRVRGMIRELPASRITNSRRSEWAVLEVIPLWYGEGGLAAPALIGTAATAAPQARHTF